MTTTWISTSTLNPREISADLIFHLGRVRTIGPREVIRRLIIIGPVTLATMGIGILVAALIARGTFASESAKLLAALGVAAALAVSVGGLLAVSTLLWSGFVTQYIRALEARRDAEEADSDAHSQLEQVSSQLTEPEEFYELVTAYLNVLPNGSAAEAARVRSDLLRVLERYRAMETGARARTRIHLRRELHKRWEFISVDEEQSPSESSSHKYSAA